MIYKYPRLISYIRALFAFSDENPSAEFLKIYWLLVTSPFLKLHVREDFTLFSITHIIHIILTCALT